MEVIPAIDLKEGRCVRLLQGEFAQEIVYSENPVEMAKTWQNKGAKRLHLVDLDGARDGQPKNLKLIEEIVENLTIPVQLGGGIRNLDVIDKYLSLGIDRVILGTVALKKPDIVAEAIRNYGVQKVVVGVDAREGKVAVKGWLETSEKKLEEVIAKMKKLGVKTFIYTDISRDGMLQGPDLLGLKRLLKLAEIEVIASGGVSSKTDLEQLSQIGIKQVIVGKALYTGDIKADFKELAKL